MIHCWSRRRYQTPRNHKDAGSVPFGSEQGMEGKSVFTKRKKKKKTHADTPVLPRK